MFDDSDSAAPPAPTEQPTFRLSFLVVDDEAHVRDAICSLIALAGHRATPAASGEEALDQLRAHGFHIVMLDLLPEEKDGIALLSRVRAEDSDVAIAILTGRPTVLNASEAIDHDISAYIQKPLSAERLSRLIDKVASRKGLSLHGERALHLTLGHNIRELRKGRSLTLKQLGRRADLSPSQISQIERAESSPSVAALFKLATALGVRVQDLFSES